MRMVLPEDRVEGWYLDPYGIHEARWFSDGTPTLLVRDGQREAHDAPPDGEPPTPLTRWEPSAQQGNNDLRRADANQRNEPLDKKNAARAVMDEGVIAMLQGPSL
jgi:hypothetical protein